ncbi:hypothetical protein G7A66_07425 [Altererythrobacter sp. SALINAS58]|nr:acyltransferase family protein [Alteripontixanthobacter muriae]NTZ42918.1 hypothetical protein [Alteripontixanthobacter muriae]
MLVFVHHFSSFAVGGSAVYVFFMLSGFWIQRMWCARYAKARSPYFTYAISRLWRLAPVMIVVSVLTVPLLMFLEVREVGIAGTQTAHFIFSTIFFLAYAWLDYLPIAPAWSLDVEMQFTCLRRFWPCSSQRWISGFSWSLQG